MGDDLVERLEALGRGGHEAADARPPPGRDLRPDVHDDEALDAVRVAAGVVHRHAPAERERHQAEAAKAEGVDEGLEVAEQRRVGVVAVGRRVGVAVTTLVEHDDVEAAGQQAGLVVPRAGVAGDAMEEDHRRRRRRAPLGVMEALAVQDDGPVGVHARIVTLIRSDR